MRKVHSSFAAVLSLPLCSSSSLWSASSISRHRSFQHSPRFLNVWRLPIRCFTSSTKSAREQQLMTLLQQVKHPASNDDVVYHGSVISLNENNGDVSIVLQLDQHYRQVKKLIEEKLENESWINSIRINMDVESSTTSSKQILNSTGTTTSSISVNSRLPVSLHGIRHIIAVSSCKGGVGKSTIATNLAYALAVDNQQVGLFDADIFGPSLPTLVGRGKFQQAGFKQDEHGMIQPYVHEGVKTMSYGYMKSQRDEAGVSPSSGKAAVMRGPMVSKLVRDLVTKTSWGMLDYLIIDFPPGTGDIPLTLTQILPIHAALIITTPQRLAHVDVIKGIQMFTTVKIPIHAVIENMAYYRCHQCETKHRLFGEGHINEIIQQYPTIPHTYQLPIIHEIASCSDAGDPFILRGRKKVDNAQEQEIEQVKEIYRTIAKDLNQSLTEKDRRTDNSTNNKNAIRYDPYDHLIVLSDDSASSVLYVDPYLLRMSCRCAVCLDEFTGQLKLSAAVPPQVKPVGFQPKGNYGMAIAWNDGHATSLYTFDQIRALSKHNKDAARPKIIK